jgi:hypothetical protein
MLSIQGALLCAVFAMGMPEEFLLIRHKAATIGDFLRNEPAGQHIFAGFSSMSFSKPPCDSGMSFFEAVLGHRS